MKRQTYGEAEVAAPRPVESCVVQHVNARRGTREYERQQSMARALWQSEERALQQSKALALANYRGARENGDVIDEPNIPFPAPRDTDFDIRVDKPIYRARYNEGGEIKEWMEQKDQNFCFRTGTFSFLVPFKSNITNKAAAAPGLINSSFLCPITHEIMLDPVFAMDGHTYERDAILQALELSMLSPMTGQPMQNNMVIPNHNTRSMIRDFLTQHPECWREVYVSTTAVNELLALSSGETSLDLQKWEAILRVNPKLLTSPLQGITLLEFLCKQTELIVTTYLPSFLDLLTLKDWQELIKIYSAQDWLKLVAQTCERCSAPCLTAEFLNKLQAGLGIKEINPLEMALYALEHKNLGLFKLALSKLKEVNVPIDEDKNTLLHLAARQGQTEMIRCLANRGAHLKQKNAAGLKAEGIARLAGFEATADQIAVFKLTPVLERMGFFNRFEALEKEVQELKASASGPSGYAKKI